MRLCSRVINTALVVLLAAAAAVAHASTQVVEATKADFLEYLATKKQIIMCFYEDNDDDSTKVLNTFEKFAESAAQEYPGLQLCKANHKNSPYLTARLLLTMIPEVRLLVKNDEGAWSAHTIGTDKDVKEMSDFIDKQRWHDQPPSDSLAHALCSPFNFCGKALAVFAEASVAFERAFPIPRWLAILLIPSLMAFVGRFIIDGMYAAEDRVRSAFGTQQRGSIPETDK